MVRTCVTWDVLLVLLNPPQDLTSCRAGARPGHPISGQVHRSKKLAIQSPRRQRRAACPAREAEHPGGLGSRLLLWNERLSRRPDSCDLNYHLTVLSP